MEESFSQQDYDAAIQEVEKWMLERDAEPPHAGHVARLAIQIFDLLGRLHRLGWRHRWMLHASALLHDVGWSESSDGRKHHKIGARMIRGHEWESFPEEWVGPVACIVRYHRRSLPRLNHGPFSRLGACDRRGVSRLAALLRVADGLDRSHLGRVERITARVGARFVTLEVEGKEDLEIEISAALKKSDLFKVAYGRNLRIMPRVIP